jgi:hypothetical protein
MDSNQPVDCASIIPSELTGQLPRRTRLAKNGIQSAVVFAILLALAVALSIRPGMNAMREMQTKEALLRDGIEAIGQVDRTAGHHLNYSFTVDGRSFTGNAFLPDRIKDSLQDSDPIQVRYLPSNPAINSPADWQESNPLAWIPFFGPAVLLLISMVVLISTRIDRRLVKEGRTAVAVVTECIERHGRGGGVNGFTIKYEFRTEDGMVINGNSSCESRPEIGGSICILYLSWNPRRNQTYSSLCCRVAE